VLGLLGIARRAGHIAIGFDAVKAAVTDGRVQLILLAADRSTKTEKELRYAAQGSSCPIRVLAADKEALAHALGLQKPVAVAATDDRGFAAAMLKACGTDTKEDVAL
jgi:ribosomal protein L7Ae-like RNA K-turn-binding protein